MAAKQKFEFYGEMSKAKRSRARRALRRNIAENVCFATDDMSANVIIEEVWNALVGHDKIEPPRRAAGG